ncbi:hypothetical protein V8G54_009725 [Vigna mungo]|uniref:Uncharacterized protein n=1 Tax=Vigna mungo TaxID=3915 RepID=A0AAQ3S553_VIGMU
MILVLLKLLVAFMRSINFIFEIDFSNIETLICLVPFRLLAHLFPSGSSSFFLKETRRTKKNIPTANPNAARVTPPAAAPAITAMLLFEFLAWQDPNPLPPHRP